MSCARDVNILKRNIVSSKNESFLKSNIIYSKAKSFMQGMLFTPYAELQGYW